MPTQKGMPGGVEPRGRDEQRRRINPYHGEPAALRTLIAAIPTNTLPEVMLALMLNGATPAAPAPAVATPTPAAKRPRGWPRGPRKPADKAARLAAQRRRDA
jgi:hypothetical protein